MPDMQTSIVQNRFQEELSRTPDPVRFAISFPERIEQAIEKATTPEEANIVRAMAAMGEEYLRRTLQKVVKDRRTRYGLMYPTESAYLDASRAAGELWAVCEGRARPGGNGSNQYKSNSENFQDSISTDAAGFKDPRDATTCVRIAALDEQDFELYKRECIENERHMTLNGAERVWHLLTPPDNDERRLEEAAKLAEQVGKFPVIVADPAWEYDFSRSDNRRIENHYPPSSLEDMQQLVPPATKDAVLFMWATSPKLREALELMEAWGFEYKTCMVWVKDKIGMGYYARQKHELLLIGTKGEGLELPDPGIRPESVFFAPRGGHSEKPEEAYEIIETMYPAYMKFEMFARKAREGWEVWGDEA